MSFTDNEERGLRDLLKRAASKGQTTLHAKSHGSDAHVPRQNFTAAAAPAVTDDSSKGYGPGSVWVDTTTQRAYTCLSGAVGAAVWTQFQATGAVSQIQMPAFDMNTHATNPKSAMVFWAGGAATFTFTLGYHTLSTVSTAQTWLLQRSVAGGAFATVITFTCASTNPMLYKYAGDVTITLAQYDRLILVHTVGDSSGVLVTAAGVRT